MRADLSGTVELKVRDGRFAGLDLGPLLEAVGADPDAAESATAFSVLSATATGSGGRFQSDDIAARSPLLRVDGGGGVDVVAETLALDLTATFVEPPPGQGSRLLAGIRVPFGVSGPWRQPAWRVDLGGALREGARRALDRHSDQLKDLEDRLGVPGLEQGLRSLFGL